MKINFLHSSITPITLLLALTASLGAQDGTHTKNTGTTSWTNPAGWDTGNIPGPADTAIINTGTLNVSGTQAIGQIRLNGGNLSGATDSATDSLTLGNGSPGSEWTSGTVQDITLTVSENGALDIGGSATKNVTSAIIQIVSGEASGLVNWTGGALRLNSNSQIQNAGDFNDSASNLMTWGSGTPGTFHNQTTGNYNKTAAGTTEFDVTFNNDGEINLDAGTIIFDGTGTNSATGTINAATGTDVIFHSNFEVADASKLAGPGQYSLQASTLTLEGVLNASDLQIEGGTLTGTHTIANGASWTGGALSAGTTTNASGSVFNFDDTSGNILNDHDVTNQSGGTINWKSGNIDARVGSVITNQGTFNDTADALFVTNSGANGSFDNQSTGIYNKDGSGTTEFDETFDNSGNINVNSGTLILDGGGTQSGSGRINAESTTTVIFDHDYTVSVASLLTGLGQYKSTAGTLTLTGSVQANDFKIDGGTIAGTQQFFGGATITNGSFAAGITTNASGSVFNFSDSGGTILTDRTFSNSSGGTINWTAGNIDARSGSNIINSGIVNDTADAVFVTNSGADGFFNIGSTGTYNKNGTGISEFDETFNNEGTVNINAGTLKLDGGGVGLSAAIFDIATGATLQIDADYAISFAAGITGSGQVEVTAGTLRLDGQASTNDLRLDGGILGGDHTLNAGATIANGSFAAGTTTNASGSTLNLSDAGTNILNDRDIINQSGAALNWTAGNIDARSGSVITNQGTLNDTADALFVTNSGTDGSFANAATGTYNKNGTGTTEFDEAFDNEGTVNINAGTLILDGTGVASVTGGFDVDTGATLQFDNNYTISDASLLTGLGTIKATSGTFELINQVQNVAILIDGATVTGTHTFHQGATLANGGFGTGQTTVANNSTLNLSDAGGNILTDRAIFIQPGSTLNWTTANIDARSGSSILLQGTLNDSADAHFTTTSGSGAFLTVSDGGTYNKNGPDTTELDKTFNNFGTVNVNSGVLVIDGGGETGSTGAFDVDEGATLQFDSNYSVAEAANLSGTGKYLLSENDLQLDGDLSVDFEQDGGDLDGSFGISAVFDWLNGSWNAAVEDALTTINSTGVLNIEDTTSFYANRDIVNNGTINWTGGTMLGDGESSFTNNGLFRDQSDFDHNISESSGSSSFTNNGTFLKTGAGTTRIDQTFTNSSPRTLDVSNGILEINGGGTNLNGGAMVINNTGLIRFTNNFTIENAADLSVGSISGPAGYELEGGDLDLGGTLNVDFVQTGGDLDGTHRIAGTYDWNGGDLSSDNDGTTTTIDFSGVLNINPTALPALFHNRDIVNEGTVNWNSANLISNAEGSFTNNGTFNDDLTTFQTFSGAPVFTNNGGYFKNKDSKTEFDSDFDNNGFVVVTDGTLYLDGGGTSASGASFTVESDGTLQIDNNYVIEGASGLLGAGKFLLSNGDLTLNGDLSADFEQTGGNLDGTQTIAGAFDLGGFGDWDATTPGASTSITETGVLTLTGNSRTFNNRNIVNSGTVNWLDGNLESNAAGSFVNWGNFIANQPEDYRFHGAAEFVNSGVFTKNDAHLADFDSAFNNDGTVNVNDGTLRIDGGGLTSSTGAIIVAPGAELHFDSDYAVSSGAKIEGDGIAKLTAGTLTLDTAVDAKDFAIAGGTLTGNSTFNNGANWTNGSLTNGRTTNAAGSTFTLNKASGNILSGYTIENDGTVEWQTSNLTLNNSSSFINRGIFNDAASSSAPNIRINRTSGTPGAFTNAAGGVYNKTTDGETEVDLIFDNQGQVNVNVGTFKLDGQGTSGASGGFNVAEGATLWFDNNYNIENANNLTGAGRFRLASGLLTVGGTISVDFLQTAGELTGTNNLSGVWDWQGGFWGGGSTTIDSVGLLNIAGSSFTIDNHIINNGGNVDWMSGFISMNNGSTISNSGTWTDNSTLSTSDNYILTNSAATASFANSGTYVKNGNGNSHLRIPLHNEGTITVNAGQLDLEAGGSIGSVGQIHTEEEASIRFFNTFDIPDASALTGGGSFTTINGAMTLQGTFAAGHFSSDNSTLTGDHDFSTSASLERTNWNDGSTTVLSGATLSIGGHNSVSGTTMSNRSLINQGTLLWNSEDLVLNDGSSISNEGLMRDENNGTTSNSRLYTASGAPGNFTNQLSGTYEKRSTDNTTFDLPFSNFGAIDVQAGKVSLRAGGFTDASSSVQIAEGATLELRSDFHIDNGANVSGNGVLVNSTGTLTGGGLIGSNFSQTSGVLDGDFNFGGQFSMTGGSIAPNHQIGITGNAISTLDTTSLDLNGTIITIGPESTLEWTRGSIRTGNDGGLNVDGIMTTDINGTILQNLGGQGGLDISGEFRKIGGTGNTTLDLPVRLSGRLEAHTGTIRITEPGISDGGLFDVAAGASIEFESGFVFNDGTTTPNGGALDLTGGVFSINDNVGLGENASITGGTITGTHTLSGQVLVDGAGFDSSGITTIATNSSLELANTEENSLPRSVVNNGKLLWSGGDLTGSGDNSLINNGEFAIGVDGTFSSSEDDFTLTNNGDMRKIGGDGITTIDVAFNNNGLVAAETGQFHFTDTLTIGSGGTLGGGVKFDAPLMLPQGSTLAGNGTIFGNITTGGNIAPGNSIGSLNIEGDLSMLSTAVSFFEIDLTATPSPVDFLSVSGTLNLNGILTYDLLSNILPNTMDTYTVLTAGTLTGSFANIASGTRIFNPGLNASFLVNYGSSSAFDQNSVVFSGFEFTPVPEPSTFSLLVIGIGFIMWQTRRRRA